MSTVWYKVPEEIFFFFLVQRTFQNQPENASFVCIRLMSMYQLVKYVETQNLFLVWGFSHFYLLHLQKAGDSVGGAFSVLC